MHYHVLGQFAGKIVIKALYKGFLQICSFLLKSLGEGYSYSKVAVKNFYCTTLNSLIYPILPDHTPLQPPESRLPWPYKTVGPNQRHLLVAEIV
jgi:hypothetical protein